MSHLSPAFKVTVTKPVYLARKRHGLRLSKANPLSPAYRQAGTGKDFYLPWILFYLNPAPIARKD